MMGTAHSTACWADAVEQVGRFLDLPRAIVAIDGRAGSGKTSLANALSDAFGANVLHLDDFYLPMERREEDWRGAPAANMDLMRFLREVLEPSSRAENVLYRPYSCREGRYLDAVTLSPARLTVVEGSYSHHPLLRGFYDLAILLTVDKDEQARRLMAREGDRYPAFAETWTPLEESYMALNGIVRAADLVIDTTEFWRTK